jgi:hypothetical protein
MSKESHIQSKDALRRKLSESNERISKGGFFPVQPKFEEMFSMSFYWILKLFP